MKKQHETMPLASETRQQILLLARKYLQSQGYNGFSFQTIADAMDIRKASLHYHFRSKEDLLKALLEDYLQLFEGWTQKIQTLPPDARLHAFFDIFKKFAREDFLICPMGALSSDFHSLSSAVQKKVLGYHQALHKWLVDTLRDGQKKGCFRRDLSTAKAADVITAIFQGGLQIARLRQNEKFIETMRDQVFEFLEKGGRGA